MIVSARAGRSVQLVAPTGYGKSALLAEPAPALDALALNLQVPKAAPFGTFLTDLAAELLRHDVLRVPLDDKKAPLQVWKNLHPGNDEKARSLVAALRDYRKSGATPPVIVVDDATGLTHCGIQSD